MDTYEATKTVFSRIQALDPENAYKITGYVLIQDHGEQEMMRLAMGPDALLHSLILNAKAHLGLSSNTSSTPPTPSSPSAFPPARPSGINPLSSLSPLQWHGVSGFSPGLAPPSSSPSYAAVVNGSSSACVGSNGFSTTVCTAPSLLPGEDAFEEYRPSFLGNSSPSSRKVELFDGGGNVLQDGMGSLGYGTGWASDAIDGGAQSYHLHRRSFSLSDACFGSDNLTPIHNPRGFFKNVGCGSFLNARGFDDSLDSPVGSPSNAGGVFDHQSHEMLRSKAAPHRLPPAPQLRHGISFPFSKCADFFASDSQRMMMGEEFHKFGRCRGERSDFSAMAMAGNVNPGARQIYLTFPADSTFKEEDVSNYFSIYGPVQDVRIPYQQKRMFGFVTFVYPETVKRILAKGNPHFVCESRVLVKPYKEKGKIPDKKLQHLERGEYPPSGFDSRDPYEFQLGSRMFYNTQEMLLRRKLEEQADLQQVIELQGKRLMNLQLMDFKNQRPYLHNRAVGTPIPTRNNQNPLILSSDQENRDTPWGEGSTSPVAATDPPEVNSANGSSEEESFKVDDCGLPESLELILPDSLFGSPRKQSSERLTAFTELEEAGEKGSLLSPTSTLTMAPKTSCSFHMSRLSSGNEAIEM